ncbi:MAG: MG2 domain-containing protein, partial [Longimicrobiaceae bacterium]
FPPRDSLQRPRSAAAPAPAPLLVTRRGPEGEVEAGAGVVVAFSQPMVPLSSVEAVAARAVPVRLTPQPPGRWRWIDVRTLRFEPEGRLPMATEFTVEVPAGTVSAAGRRLEEAVRWTFSTPPPRATGAWPQEGPTVHDPLLFVVFDQRVDPAAVLRVVRVRAGRREVPVRLATGAEVAADSAVRALAAAEPAGRWVAFRAVRPLPAGTEIRVEVGPGTPSAEGPRTTTTVQQWTFETYGPLRLEQRGCGGRNECRPGTPFVFGFNNPLAPLDSAAALALVRVEPALPGLRVEVSGSMLLVFGQGQAGTRYTVRVDGRLRDVFGQTLGKAVTQRARVGEPYPGLSGPSGMMVLDPAGPPRISVFSHDHARLRVRLHRVGPEHWPAFVRRGIYRPEDGGPAPLPGIEADVRVLSIDAPPDEVTESAIDLTPALREGVGQVLVAVEAQDGPQGARRQSVYFWVQVTRIGLTAFVGRDLVGWASSLVDGRPLAGARLSLGPDGDAAATGPDGLATLTLPAQDPPDAMLVGRLGADVAFLPRERAGAVFGWRPWVRQDTPDALAWYAFTDRNLYRPGETVRFKGWVRRIAPGKDGGVALLAGAGARVAWSAFDARHNEVARGTSALTALGGFDGSFAVPAGANLGQSQLEIRLEGSAEPLNGAQFTTVYQVQEFRRPEYTVSVSAQEGPHFIGGSAEVTAKASYFAGGALPGAPVHWQVTATPGSYTPPGWDEWTFGEAPVFFFRAGRGGRGDARSQGLDGATDAAGQHVLRIGFTRGDPPRPYTVEAEATVTDVNRQTWSASTTLLVHPAEVYVGLRTRRAWLQAGDSIDLDLVVVDLDGKPVAGRTIHTSAVRRGWRQERGEWKEVVEDSTACVRESAPQPVRCVFRAAEAGRYEIESTATDARGRTARSTLTVWVSGGRGFAMGPEENGETQAELIPDRRGYAVGDTARLLLRTQFVPARALLTVRREGLVRSEEIRVAGPLTTIEVPIGEGDVPNVHVQVDLVGASDGRHGEGARGVSFAVATVSLSVPPATRTLAVKPLPRDTAAAPDAQTEVAVEVRDPAGRPVAGAEVALVVVDEAVLALSGYSIPNPLGSFYRFRGPGVSEARIRPLVQVVAPDFEPAPHTLVGRVVDARNGGYIGGAWVSLAGSRDSVRTDDAGRFRLTSVASGRRTVVVRFAGYATARVEVEVGETGPAPL